jgi:O-antigen ligase
MDGWSIPKALYVISVAALMSLVLAAVVSVQNKKVSLQLNLIDGFAGLFAGYILVRGFVTAHFSPLNPWFLAVFVLAGIYFLLKTLFRRDFTHRSGQLVYILIGCLLLVGLAQAVIGLLQLYGALAAHNRYFKLTGSFGNPNYYAGYLAVIIPVAAGMALYSGKKLSSPILKYVGALAFWVCLLGIAATYTRASWLAAAAGIGFIVVCRYHLWAKFTKAANTAAKKAVCGIAAVCLLVALGAGLYKLKPDSSYGRLLIWKITAARMVPEHPLFGAGFNRFKANYDNEQAAYFASGNGSKKEKWVAGNVKKAHNEYLQILSELGVAGLLLFGGLLFHLFWSRNGLNDIKHTKTDEDKRWFLITMMASLLAAGVLAFFSFPFHILPTLVNIIFMGACCSALRPSIFQLTIPLNKKRIRIRIAAVLMVAAAAGFYYIYRTFSLYDRWNGAVRVGFTAQPKMADSLFARLYPSFKNNGKFLFTWGSFETRSKKYPKAIPLLEKARADFAGPHLDLLLAKCYQNIGQIQKAEQSLKHAIWMRPDQLYPRYLLVKLYQQAGDRPKAVREARQIRSMKVKVRTPAARQIKQKMQKFIETINVQ